MGTNFYARIIPSKERKEHLKKLIDNDGFDLIEDEIKELYCNEIHLGKRSSGWKFLFNPNHEKYYKLTKKGLRKFLKRKDVIIYNEYFFNSDHKFEYTEDPDNSKNEYLWTAEQFLDMAINWGQEDGWDGESYEKWELQRNPDYFGYRRFGDSHEEEWRTRGYSPNYFNFFNDGLRWSTCCEFG